MPGYILIPLIILGSLCAIALLFGLLYLLVLVRPHGKVPPDSRLLCDYAHRGLHGNGVPENSLRAFALACEAGYGIELDVQLSHDGEVMVFHDYVLSRMTDSDRKLCELSAAWLGELHLAGTDETIPSFIQVLRLVDGRVPILVELKGENLNISLCRKVAAYLRAYDGPYCIESFNPLLLRAIKQELPDAYCGLLYTNVVRDKQKASPLHLALTAMAFNCLCRPHFIAYNQADRHTLPVHLTTRLYRAPKFVWTARGRDAVNTAHTHGECAIFEKGND